MDRGALLAVMFTIGCFVLVVLDEFGVVRRRRIRRKRRGAKRRHQLL